MVTIKLRIWLLLHATADQVPLLTHSAYRLFAYAACYRTSIAVTTRLVTTVTISGIGSSSVMLQRVCDTSGRNLRKPPYICSGVNSLEVLLFSQLNMTAILLIMKSSEKLRFSGLFILLSVYIFIYLQSSYIYIIHIIIYTETTETTFQKNI